MRVAWPDCCFCLAASLVWAMACADAAPTTAPAPREPAAHSPSTPVAPSAAPVEPSASPAATTSAATDRPRSVRPKLAPRACAIVGDRVLREGAAWGVVAAGSAGPLALTWLPPRRLEAHAWTPAAALSNVASTELESPAVSLAATQQRGTWHVALVDERARLSLLTLAGAKLSAPRTLAEGVDRRFAPALAVQGDTLLVAFTRTVDAAMHTFVARVRGGETQLVDVTPVSHGAAAPAFVVGSEAPILLAIDARAGLSPLLEIPFDDAGQPRAAIVRTPVSQPYAPPRIGGVWLDGEHVEVAYTAIGRAAATAIGRVPLRSVRDPVALEPSTGYGELTFSVARGTRRAVFAMDVPAVGDAARRLSIKVLDLEAEGSELSITSGATGAQRPSLATDRADGTFWLVYTGEGGVRLAELACDA